MTKGLSIATLCLTALVTSGAFAQPPPPPRPPPEAIAACKALKASDPCSVKLGNQILRGVCRPPPERQALPLAAAKSNASPPNASAASLPRPPQVGGPLACVPNGPRPAP